jgi:hypothetical protein
MHSASAISALERPWPISLSTSRRLPHRLPGERFSAAQLQHDGSPNWATRRVGSNLST